MIKQDIDVILQDQVNGCIIRSKIDWHEFGEKSSKFFLNLEKRNYNNKTIKCLRLTNGEMITQKETILHELHAFYSKLYTSSHEQSINFSELDNLPLPKLDTEKQLLCEGALTENEILSALKTCKNNKSPGTDGFPAEFYKFFWNDMKQYLLDALNYNYAQGQLSSTQKEGLITLIPKKGKDTLLIKNWRPITLLNQDYKLATKSIAKRMCKVLPNIINEDQTGFLRGRYIGENIFKITNLMDHLDEHNEPALLISADFQKAFDSLEWDFIVYCLNLFNFGPSIIKWIKVFHTNTTTRVSNNGWVTNMFNPSRGSRQGCPLSPYTFLICAEILGCLFRNDPSILGIQIQNHKFVVSQYADDTIITIAYSEHNLRKAVNIFETFAIYSGLKLNYDKSQVMPLGSIKHDYDILVPESGFEWCEGPIKCLGVDICHRTEDLLKLNYARALEKIKAIIQIWDKRYLTLFGKVMILNSFIISQLIYLLSVLPAPPKNTMTQINKLIFEFMWNGKPDKIKRNIMILAKEHGGMAVPDIMMKNIALKVAWVQRIVTTEAKWKSVISTHIPINLDIFWKCNMKENDVHMVTNKFRNTFVKEIIQSWFDYSYYNPSNIDSIRCQVIWFNSHIKVNNCTIFNNLMYDNGIIYIHQLFDENGEAISIYQIERRHAIHIDILEYYGIISAIPRPWKRILKTQCRAIQTDYTPKAFIALEKNNHVCKYVHTDLLKRFHGRQTYCHWIYKMGSLSS